MSRISYRNFPILEKIKAGKLGTIPVLEEDQENFMKILPLLKQVFEEQHGEFLKKIISVSEPFLEAMYKAKNKLLQIVNDEIFGDKDFLDSGTIIAGKTVIMFYMEGTNDELNFTFWKTDREGIFDYVYLNYEKEYHLCTNGYKFKSEEENKETGMFYAAMVAQILMFKKYASVETVISKAKSKTKQIDCKYLNETDMDIEYLDSKWFTTLVNSTGFKVRGFFRLQPKKKDGEWTKELIWIDEFEKHGYHRKAKILNPEEHDTKRAN